MSDDLVDHRNEPWTDEQDQELLQLAFLGVDPESIALSLGRSLPAVIARHEIQFAHNHWKRWDEFQDAELRDLFQRGAAVADMAFAVGRTSSAVLLRLEHYGLVVRVGNLVYRIGRAVSAGAPIGETPLPGNHRKTWEASEDAELLEYLAREASIEEMARLLGRTSTAISGRLLQTKRVVAFSDGRSLHNWGSARARSLASYRPINILFC